MLLTVEDIENAIAALGPSEFNQLQVWFEKLLAERFDRQIEDDAKAGKLDGLVNEAINDHHKGRSRTL